ncbi:MAG: NAD-dependent epimerase/dehydratase family protein [Actinobacteria bacterium]|nr:NAD-dependent epimerase/dehydratase family protein [Actinomycetota bacterium]
MLAFVTGGTGFVGGRLVDALLEGGHKVRALVRDPARAPLLQRSGVELVRGDLARPDGLDEAVAGAAVAFHCAGLVGDWLRPDEAQRVNVEGTRVLLAACAAAGAARVVYLSSLSVYGLGQHRGTDESAPLRYSGGSDAYIDSKIDAERMVRMYVDRAGPEVVILRPGFIYGPGDRLFLPKVLAALGGGQFAYVGDGTKLLNLSYVDDVAAAMLLAATVPAAAGQTYNVTDGTETSLRDFVEFLCRELGIPAPTKRIPPPVAFAACYAAEALARARRAKQAPRLSRGRMRFLYYNQLYSGDKARRQLGYRPRYTYREGIAPTLAWYREQNLLPDALVAS